MIARDRNEEATGSSSESATDDSPAAEPVTERIELLEQLRLKNRTVVFQCERIAELEAVMNCVVYFAAKLKQLEAEQNL